MKLEVWAYFISALSSYLQIPILRDSIAVSNISQKHSRKYILTGNVSHMSPEISTYQGRGRARIPFKS